MKANIYFSRLCVVFSVVLMGISSVTAKEIEPAVLESTQQVDGQTLVLNGSGPVTVNRVKIYNVGLYLPKQLSTAQEVLTSPNVIRVKIAMLKSIESEVMSRRFLADLHANTSKDDRLKIASQMIVMGTGFSTVGDWKVGDTMTVDWLPGRGTELRWNNKPVGEVLKDQLLMQSILKIWIGDAVYDTKLKRLLLGSKE